MAAMHVAVVLQVVESEVELVEVVVKVVAKFKEAVVDEWMVMGNMAAVVELERYAVEVVVVVAVVTSSWQRQCCCGGVYDDLNLLVAAVSVGLIVLRVCLE